MKFLTAFWAAFWAAFLAAALALGGPAAAGNDDHERARRAVEEGRILPLKDILSRANRAYPGQVIETEFEDEGGIAVYEIKILTPDSRVMKLVYDASTGELVKAGGRDGRR